MTSEQIALIEAILFVSKDPVEPAWLKSLVQRKGKIIDLGTAEAIQSSSQN